MWPGATEFQTLHAYRSVTNPYRHLAWSRVGGSWVYFQCMYFGSKWSRVYTFKKDWLAEGSLNLGSRHSGVSPRGSYGQFFYKLAAHLLHARISLLFLIFTCLINFIIVFSCRFLEVIMVYNITVGWQISI